MAQPTDTPDRFEVSEPSTALPVPALSRYVRPAPAPAPADDPKQATPPREPAAAEAPSTGPEPVAQRAPARPLEPIVQPASEEWATNPSPPQPVGDARAAGAAHPPALRDEPRRASDEGGRRRPFWRRLAMARPHADPSPPSAPPVPKDLLRPAVERIDHLTRRFEREQKALHERIDELEHNLTRLWELEEQMSLEEVRAQLAVMRANQEEIADGLHAIARRVAVGAGAVCAVFGALLIWLVL